MGEDIKQDDWKGHPTSRAPTGSAQVAAATGQQVSFLLDPTLLLLSPGRGGPEESPLNILRANCHFRGLPRSQTQTPTFTKSQRGRTVSVTFTREEIESQGSSNFRKVKKSDNKPKYLQPQSLWSCHSRLCLQGGSSDETEVKHSQGGQIGHSPHCCTGKIACPKPYCHGCGSFACYLIEQWSLNVCSLLLAHCLLRNRLSFPSYVCLVPYKLEPSVALKVNDIFPQRLPYLFVYKGNQTRHFTVLIGKHLKALGNNTWVAIPIHLKIMSRDISSKFIMSGFRTTIKVKQWAMAINQTGFFFHFY